MSRPAFITPSHDFGAFHHIISYDVGKPQSSVFMLSISLLGIRDVMGHQRNSMKDIRISMTDMALLVSLVFPLTTNLNDLYQQNSRLTFFLTGFSTLV